MRCYADWRGMAQVEATRKDGIEVVSVVTPNASHHAICKTFLEAGIDVICDKPLTMTFAEAQDLLAMVRRTGRLLGVTYTYTGYPMVREARALIESGALGAVRVVQVEFALGWLSGAQRRRQQASGLAHGSGASRRLLHRWRSRHALLPLERIRRWPTHGGAGRRPADHGAGLAARGQRAYPPALRQWRARRDVGFCGCGRRGDRAAAPRLWRKRPYRGSRATPISSLLPFSEASRTLLRGRSGLSSAAKRATRIVAGLPEGYFEAFATLYRDYADILVARQAGAAPDPLALWAPTAADGVRGMAFVEAALASNADGGRWRSFQPEI